MQNNELKRLQKVEQRIYEIARENGLEFCDIEFDIIPAEKMFEINYDEYIVGPCSGCQRLQP